MLERLTRGSTATIRNYHRSSGKGAVKQGAAKSPFFGELAKLMVPSSPTADTEGASDSLLAQMLRDAEPEDDR